MDKEFLLKAYEKMSRIRQFDMWIHETVKKDDSPLMGLMHSHVGEEAYSSAVISQLRHDDYISTTYRNHAHSIARDISLKKLAAELCGRETGVCKARAGNMHAIDQDLNIIAGFGIIGAGLPATVGTAFASKYKGTDQISVAFFGDGAIAQGAFHESMNLASLFKLPVLFINNNNKYAMSTPSSYNLIGGSTVHYAKGYEMPAVSSSGMEFFEAYETAKKAIDYVRNGNGPYFIEYDCYRFHGQWEGDAQKYKPQEEVDYFLANDPMILFRKKAVEKDLLTNEEIDIVDANVAELVEDAFQYAISCKMPALSDITSDIYADVYGNEVG